MGMSRSGRLLYAGLTLTMVALVGLGFVAFVNRGGGSRPGGAAGADWPAPTGPATSTPATSPSGTAAPTSPAARPSGTPAAAPGGKPGSANTGVPLGTRPRVIRGDQTYTRDNQVIDGLDIHGFVRIAAKNVTIRNSIVRGGSPTCNSAVIRIDDDASATILDSEVVASRPHPCLDGIWATNARLIRLDIHGVVDGVKAYDNVLLQDSYVHDLSWFASDPNQDGEATHNDAVQTYEGNTNIVLRRNTLTVGREGNAAYQVTQDGGEAATNLRIEGNWLDGGGCTLNFAHKGGPTPMTGIYVIGNRFGRDSKFNCPILVSTQTMLTEVSGNTWEDTGTPIPRPQRHD
ncbi:MAG TPA: hypothetical protein VF163_15600 [Micromonosporaceae bacterium]